jgi:hypothetical protein
MHGSYRGRWLALGLVLAGLVTAGPLGCGSEENKVERGLAVDQEEAVPESAKELQMTETEREAQVDREMEKEGVKEFDESQR